MTLFLTYLTGKFNDKYILFNGFSLVEIIT